jgi:hypothetical protein
VEQWLPAVAKVKPILALLWIVAEDRCGTAWFTLIAEPVLFH